LIYAVTAVECLDVSADNVDGILGVGKGFFYVNIYIHRIDKSYAGLQSTCVLEIEIGITKKNLSLLHSRGLSDKGM
jgi:hypothetical protein